VAPCICSNCGCPAREEIGRFFKKTDDTFKHHFPSDKPITVVNRVKSLFLISEKNHKAYMDSAHFDNNQVKSWESKHYRIVSNARI
jgi:hypothetical protein